MGEQTGNQAILKAQLRALLAAKPETGEQWADICALEAQIAQIEARS